MVGDIVSTNTLSGGSWLEVIRVFCVIVFGSPFSSTIVILNVAYSSIARSWMELVVILGIHYCFDLIQIALYQKSWQYSLQ